MKPRVSFCLIARDEAENLARCMEPIASLVDEIVVIDTGSTDATRSIAERLGANVFDFPWRHDFAAARNQWLTRATGDWIFWLDADDRVPPPSVPKLADLFESLPDANVGFLMQITSPAPDGGPSHEHAHVRLFRRLPEHRWELRVHEQILPALVANGARIVPTGIPIAHVGYRDPNVVQRKLERNLRLADLDCEDRPLHPLPHHSRALTLLELGRASEALVALNLCEAFAACSGADAVQRGLPALKARALILEDRLAEALDEVRIALERAPTDAPLLFLEVRLMAALGDFDGAESRARGQLVVAGQHHVFSFIDRTLAEFRVRHFLAELLLAAGRVAEAAEEAQRVVDARPAFGLAWLVLGEALLRTGRTDAFDALDERLARVTGAAFARELLRAERLLVEGDAHAALALIEARVQSMLDDLCLRRVHVRALDAIGEQRDRLQDALRAVFGVDPLCMRSRSISRRLARPAGWPAERDDFRRRAGSALGPLVARD